jgi:enoyl-CoA hydratase/carnithine racemase
MFVAAETITAERALRMGLVDVVCPLPEKQAISRLGISQDGKDV